MRLRPNSGGGCVLASKLPVCSRVPLVMKMFGLPQVYLYRTCKAYLCTQRFSAALPYLAVSLILKKNTIQCAVSLAWKV
jgi:hypothetical protein